jgi:hypothetical protein
MLSNTFSQIVANAVPEIQYRRAVLTFEGVKSDAIFAYMPPFNILALVVMLPLKLILTPHTFHKVNVTATRTLNFPLLLLISLYERRTLWMADRHRHRRSSPNSITWAQAVGSAGGIRKKTSNSLASLLSLWDFSRFSVHSDIAAVFDTEPPESVLAAIAEEDDENSAPEGIGKSLLDDLHRQVNDEHEQAKSNSSRRGSSALGSDPEDTARKVAKRTRFGGGAKPSWKRRDSQTTASLKREFADSGDDSEDSEGHAKLHRRLMRGERMDSIIDYSGEGDSGIHEANTRLHKLEDGMKRLESLLLQILDTNDGSEQEAAEGRQEVEREAESGILE